MMIRRSAAAMVAILGVAAIAAAQPNVNSAKLNTRIFNDFPGSSLGSTNAYPGMVQISDANLVNTPPGGFANRHNWRVSADGGATNATFMNSHNYSLFADVTLSGTGNGEVGMQLSPWWSQNVDGVMMLNGVSGEVAMFGGRLPFYSFTAAQSVNYVKGTTVRFGFEYAARSNSAADPAQIRYWYNTLNSGWLNFDEGNPTEPFGTWGAVNDATAGGYLQVVGPETGAGNLIGTWENIAYVPTPGSMGVLALGGLLAARRRRRA